MKNFFYWFILFFAFSSCTDRQTVRQKKSELFPAESNYIINLDGKVEPHILYSAFFKKPKIILLETNDDCLIGLVTTLQVYEGYIYILEHYFAKSLFVFNMDGCFIRKIGSLGNGPGEYTQPLDFTLDTENGFIFLADRGSRIHKYQLDGTFVQTISPNLEEERIHEIQYYNGKLYMDVLGFRPDADDFKLYKADAKTGKILSKSIPLSYNMGWDLAVYSSQNYSFLV